MKPIKAVLFDFDGVLTLDETGSQSICRYICRETGVDAALFKEVYGRYNRDLLYGKIRHEDIWDRICEDIGTGIDIQILYDSFVHTPINWELIALVRELKDNRYITGMITDNKKDRMECIVEFHRFDQIFDAVVVSADVGSGKEESAIFMYALKILNVCAEECVFIDNKAENLRVPETMGMKTVFFNTASRNGDQIREYIKGHNMNDGGSKTWFI